ncbi:hypothetical protein [Sphingomonas immobilis]|uniref:Uncharacterized protein n=1 Tax=Sphingomonas immobilis TaxID=3063997 RepID=A0ABT9A2H6_9SPHN|nr:hypothetical protein [Sphingomonas sp. CA1-15]MDO7844015.1 hypothetical protein [Sphingomonas sp. CA1-15]
MSLFAGDYNLQALVAAVVGAWLYVSEPPSARIAGGTASRTRALWRLSGIVLMLGAAAYLVVQVAGGAA